MVHANNSIPNISEMADEQQCNLTSFVVGQLRNLGVKVPKLKKPRASAKQASRRSSGQGHGRIFGVPLEDQELVVSEETGIPVPMFLKLTTEYLLQSKCSDGVFRKAGSISRQRELRRNIEEGQSLQDAQVHDVAGILKQWYRELPETVVPKHMNELIMRCMQLQCTDLQVQAFQLVSLLLPAAHLHVLRHTLLFLSAIAQESGANRMDAHNLAVVMAPNLLTSRGETMPPKKASELLQSQTRFVELMISHAQQVGQLPALPRTYTTSDDELEQSGDELGERKTRKQGILVNKLRRIVPRGRGTPSNCHPTPPSRATPLRVCEPATLDLVVMDCSPRLPSTISSRSDLKRRASAMSTGQRELKAENPNLGPSPRKKARPLQAASSEKLSVCDAAVISRRRTLRGSKQSVTSLVSIDPLTAGFADDKCRKAPVQRYSTRSLKNAPSSSITENSCTDGGGKKTMDVPKCGRRSLTFFVGCYAVGSEEAVTPERKAPTPGTVKSRRTLKRGRPNTIQTGLPSPFKPNPDILTPQAARKTPRSIKFGAPTVSGALSGSSCSLVDMSTLEDQMFGGDTTADDSKDVVQLPVECERTLEAPEGFTDIGGSNLSRQSSYTTICGGLGNSMESDEALRNIEEASSSDTVQPPSDEVLREIRAEDAAMAASACTAQTESAAVQSSRENDADCNAVNLDERQVCETQERHRLSSEESSFSVSRLCIADTTPTPPKPPKPEGQAVAKRSKKHSVKNLTELVRSETWATPLPPARDDDLDYSRRESIIQIRKRNAGMVRHNIRLFSQQPSSDNFCTPTRPPVRKAASVRAGPTFVRNSNETRSLRSNPSTGGLHRPTTERSPLQQTNRMDIGISRKPSMKSDKQVRKRSGDGLKEWVMEV